MTDDELADWRGALSPLDPPATDDEICMLDGYFYSPWQDYDAAALLEMYRLGKATR